MSVADLDNPTVTAKVHCSTTKGSIDLELYRDWAPLGADHFIDLVKRGFFHDIAMYRCVKDFLTQFGISENPEFKHMHREEIRDDTNLHIPIKKGYLSYAGGGPNTRSTQVFIAFADLNFLGNEPWETPFGKVVTGFDVLDKLYKEYGDITPFGTGPDQGQIHEQGNSYIRNQFPRTDFIIDCSIMDVVEFEDHRRELTAIPSVAEPLPAIKSLSLRVGDIQLTKGGKGGNNNLTLSEQGALGAFGVVALIIMYMVFFSRRRGIFAPAKMKK